MAILWLRGGNKGYYSDRGNKKTRKVIPIKTETILDLNYFVIPEMLKSEGYVTGHFGKWHMGPKGFYPEQSGFDVNIAGNENGGPGKGGYFSPYLNPMLEDGPEGEYLTDRIGDEAIKFIDENQKRYSAKFLIETIWKVI